VAVAILIIPVLLLYPILAITRKSRKPRVPRNIVITGANSGIGEALALYYAKAGVTLALTGRNKERLQKVGSACQAKGSDVVLGAIDVTDKPAMERFLLDFDQKNPVDLVIANAGVSMGTSGASKDLVASTRIIYQINVDGVFNTVLPLLQAMKDRRSGQIAIMSSVAGTGILPESAAYSSSKTAMRTWGEALRAMVYRDGVFVNVICPGFVESPMTDNAGRTGTYMPLLVKMPDAIRRIVQGLESDEPVIIFPRLLYFFGILFQFVAAQCASHRCCYTTDSWI